MKLIIKDSLGSVHKSDQIKGDAGSFARAIENVMKDRRSGGYISIPISGADRIFNLDHVVWIEVSE